MDQVAVSPEAPIVRTKEVDPIKVLVEGPVWEGGGTGNRWDDRQRGEMYCPLH